MNDRKFFIIALILLLGIGIGSFVFGRAMGVKSVIADFERERESITNLNAVASYLVYSEIALQISEGNMGGAKCNASVIASSYARQVRQCLRENSCRAEIQGEVEKGAPELLDGSKLKFTYYENGESCLESKPDK